MLKKLAACLLIIAALLPLLACSGEVESAFAYDLAAPPAVLDPQFATDPAAMLIIYNTFEGLLVQRADGTISPGVAESYTLSADQLTYTFTLRTDATWSNGTPVTAGDFVFAFSRLFDPAAPSPYANNLRMLRNSSEVLDGTLPLTALGIRALGDRTLEVRLRQKAQDLPLLLTSSYTMPCNESFFTAQQGRYGVDQGRTLYNGPFTIAGMGAKSISLQKSSSYRSELPAVADKITLHIGRGDAQQLFLEGRSDAGILSFENLDRLPAGATYETFDNITYALLFKQQGTEFQNRDIRTAMALAIDRAALHDMLEDDASVSGNFIPNAVRLGGGSYRELVGNMPPPQLALGILEAFLAGLEAQRLTKLAPTDLLVPEGRMERMVAGVLQKSWTSTLNAYINVLPLPEHELQQRLASRSFRLALVSFASADGHPGALFEQFMNTSGKNYSGYYSEEYNLNVDTATLSLDPATAAAYFAQAERELTEQAVIIPLYQASSYYASATGVTGIEALSPYEGKIYFKYAHRAS